MTTRTATPPVIFTDDGWILGDEPPVTVEDLREKVVGSYAGTGGGLWWSIGDHEVYHYETQVGEIFGEDMERLDQTVDSFVHSATPGVTHRIATNVKALLKSGGPLAIMSQLCREAGMQFFPRVRMNSHYVIDSQHPGYGRFRRENPELLIGRPDELLPENSIEWAIRTGLNYAFPEVRAHMARIIFEVFERFDVDGVELDFMRHPAFFRMEEAYANRYLMTDLVQRVRKRLKAVSAKRGKDLLLAVRVPPTLADSVRIGLDVQHWMTQELVDIVVVGGGFIPFETPVSEFVEAARGTTCRVYGCIEATRYVDERNLRALASRWWEDGASGIYLYNFYTMSAEWNRRIYAQLSDAAAIRHTDKRYEMDRAGPVSPIEGHSGAFRYASPETQLPVVVQAGSAGEGPVLRMRVSDDVEAASAEGVLDSCNLVLRLQNLAGDNQLEVKLNHEAIPWSLAQISFAGWKRLQAGSLFWSRYPSYPVEVEQAGTRVEFTIACPPLKYGENEVEIHLLSGSREGREPVVLEGMEINVAYK